MTDRPALLVVALLLFGDGPCRAESDDLAAEVQSGIERVFAARSQDAQQAAFESLVGLGCRAVPALVDHLEDRRELPVAYLKLANDSPEAFEAFRQYGPEVMTDALAAVREHITLWDCGFIFNGAPEAERAKTVQCWQKFVHDTPAKSCGRK